MLDSRRIRVGAIAGMSVLLTAGLGGQTPEASRVFTAPFPPEEFAARRARLMSRIGDGIAVIQGAPEQPAERQFRQDNEFYYLTGVDVARAILLVDGRAKRSTLYLPARDRASAFGPLLHPGADAARETGIEAVVARDSFAVDLPRVVGSGRRIVTPFRPEVLGSGSAGDASA